MVKNNRIAKSTYQFGFRKNDRPKVTINAAVEISINRLRINFLLLELSKKRIFSYRGIG